MDGPCVIVTGATGLIGQRALVRLLRREPRLSAYVIVRHPDRWPGRARFAWIGSERVTSIVGDLRKPGLGLDAPTRRQLRRRTCAVLHLAGDNFVSRPLGEARATNVVGTANLLDLTAGWSTRFCYLSTVYVAGRRTGEIMESDPGGQAGWVNAFEQSKWEAEQLVRRHVDDFVILRAATVVGDTPAVRLSRPGVVPGALRLIRAGCVSMLPGDPTAPVDLVPAGHVARAVAALALRQELRAETLHIAAGANSAPVGTLLGIAWERWAADPEWRRRGITPPVMTDPATYRMFESTGATAANQRFLGISRSLGDFVPHLAMPKHFDTRRADAVLDFRPPSVTEFWDRLLEGMIHGSAANGSPENWIQPSPESPPRVDPDPLPIAASVGGYVIRPPGRTDLR